MDIDVEDPTTTPRQELEKSVRKAAFLAQQLAVDLAIVTSIEAFWLGLPMLYEKLDSGLRRRKERSRVRGKA